MKRSGLALVVAAALVGAPPSTAADAKSPMRGALPRGAVVTHMGKSSLATAVTTQADGKIIVGGVAAVRKRAGFALIRYLENGRVDRTFARFPTVEGPPGGLSALALQSDGKIVAIGGGSGNFLVARYLPNGQLDSSFGGVGFVQTDFGQIDGASAILIQPDGKIVVAGTAGGNVLGPDETFRFAVARYNPDGTRDAAFGSDGRATASFSGSAFALALRAAADGSITVGGVHDPDPIQQRTELALVRFSSTGVADPSFGAGGVQLAPFPPASYNSQERFVSGMKFLPDGRAVAAGDALIGRKDRVVVERLLADGSPDPTLGPGGASVFAGLGLLFAVNADSSGAVFAASAAFFGPLGNDQGLLVSKFSSSGGFDRSFGRRGISAMRFRSSKAEPAAITTDQFGRVLIAGSLKKHRKKKNLLLVRLRSGGGLDGGFGPRKRRREHERR